MDIVTLFGDIDECCQTFEPQYKQSKKMAALVGVAPYTRDSGIWRGKRRLLGGRARVRSTFSMATMVATRHNPVIRTCSERLCGAGKAKKVALTACMRQ